MMRAELHIREEERKRAGIIYEKKRNFLQKK